eukprot:scaffold123292_cov33-Phaeocystis_antarctica.AAC.1
MPEGTSDRPSLPRPPFTRSRVSALFDRPAARPGAWRTVGSVRSTRGLPRGGPRGGLEVVVVASERGAGSTLRKVGVI